MVEVRRCRAEDFEAIISLLRQLWVNKTIDPAAIRPIFDRALNSDSKEYLCAIEGDSLIGFGSFAMKNSLWPEGPLGYVDELVVDGKFRGKGVGRQLLDELVSLAKRKGCSRLELDSAFYREESHRFYERYGFERRAYVFSKVL